MADETDNQRVMEQANDDHRGIPRDADGNPVFLILPPGMRASYERKMAKCEAGWRATGDPAFLTEAEILTYLHRQVSPLWLTETNIALNAKRRTKGYAKRAIEAHIRWMRYDAVRTAKEDGLRWLLDRAKAATEHAAKEKKRAAELTRDAKVKAEHAAEAAKAERAAEAATEHARDAKRRAEKIEDRGRVTWPEARVLAAENLAGTKAAGEPDTQRKDYEEVKTDFEEGRGAEYLFPKLPRKTLTEALKAHD
jgi:hypothetical protein